MMANIFNNSWVSRRNSCSSFSYLFFSVTLVLRGKQVVPSPSRKYQSPYLETEVEAWWSWVPESVTTRPRKSNGEKGIYHDATYRPDVNSTVIMLLRMKGRMIEILVIR